MKKFAITLLLVCSFVSINAGSSKGVQKIFKVIQEMMKQKGRCEESCGIEGLKSNVIVKKTDDGVFVESGIEDFALLEGVEELCKAKNEKDFGSSPKHYVITNHDCLCCVLKRKK